MVKGPLNLNITALGEKLWPVAWKEKNTVTVNTVLCKEGKSKNAYKKGENENFEKKKCVSFSCPKNHSIKK